MKQFSPPQKSGNKGKEPAKKSQTQSRPINASVDYIVHLQQTIGNQAVQRMINSGTLQLKDYSPQPGDVYSREIQRLVESVESGPPGVPQLNPKKPKKKKDYIKKDYLDNVATPVRDARLTNNGRKWCDVLVNCGVLRTDGTTHEVVTSSGSGGIHAEERMIDQYRGLDTKPKKIELYTEKIPCKEKCDKRINNELPTRAIVYYSFDTQDEKTKGIGKFLWSQRRRPTLGGKLVPKEEVE